MHEVCVQGACAQGGYVHVVCVHGGYVHGGSVLGGCVHGGRAHEIVTLTIWSSMAKTRISS